MSFEHIKGQDKPIRLLKESVKSSRLGGSYLFTGEEGIGKKFTAKTLAKALNCENQALDSCDKCASCMKIEKGQHPDVHLIDGSLTLLTVGLEHSQIAASRITEPAESGSIKIEHIRRLQKDINLKPYEGKKKVFIIDNAHNLTEEASNALLKILEEPPAQSLIILISAKPSALFKTIVSRCQAIKFFPLERSGLEAILKNDFSLDNSLAHYLAYFCEGRIGDALKLKDADILRQKNAIIDSFLSVKAQALERLSAEKRNNMRAYLNILAGWFRDMYLVKIGTPYNELINLDRKDELLRLMPRYTFVDLYEIFDSLSNSLLYLEENINAKLLFSNLREDISYGARRAA